MNSHLDQLLKARPGVNLNETYGNKLYPTNVEGYPQRSSRYDIDAPGTAISNNTNTAILVINSFDRDITKYPHPSKYSINLKSEYRDIVAVELTSANFPNSGYVVDNNNNLLHFQDTQEDIDGGNVRIAMIESGDWDLENGTTLSTKIEEALNEASDSNTYTVTIDINKRKFTITQDGGGTGVFNLIFEGKTMHKNNGDNDYFYPSNSIGRLIGFSRISLFDETEYTSDLTYDLKPDQFLVLKIRHLNRLESYNDSVDGSFAIIAQDNSFSNFQFAKDTDGINTHRYVKHFISPLPKLNEFDIEIRTLEGNLYDFNGHEHYLTFEIQSLTRVESYTSRINRMNTMHHMQQHMH